MAIELRISNEIASGSLAITVNPQDAQVLRQFLEESAKHRILYKISLGHIMQMVSRAKKINKMAGNTGGGKRDAAETSRKK